jgi:hypothetical protein
MPIVGSPSSSASGPTIVNGTALFGNASLPNGQGTLGWVNLNDFTNTFLLDFRTDDDNRQIQISQLLYRAKGAYTSDDFSQRVLTLPMRYQEDATHSAGRFLAQLSQAGEQQLTFDNATNIPVKYKGIRNRRLVRRFPPYLWEFDLEFVAKTPWFQDNASTSISSVAIINTPTVTPTGTALAGGALTAGTYTLSYTYVTASGETAASPISSGIVLSAGNLQITVNAVEAFPSYATARKWYFNPGSPTTGFTVSVANNNSFTLNTAGNSTAAPTTTPATQFSVTYPGSVFTEPIFTLNIGAGNPAAIASCALNNTMSGENLTVLFTSLAVIPASTARTVTIDCGAWTVSDSGGSYDVNGSFPMLYPPVNQANTYAIGITTVSGTSTGLTLTGSFTNRWQI